MTTTLEAAQQYTAQGWPVFPLRPRSKQPATQHGVKDAGVHAHWLEDWWGARPDLNIAIACGAPGPDVLDIDDPDAVPNLVDAARAAGAMGVRTRRGMQFYFAGTDLPGQGFTWGEMRRAGQYVVAPPSIHPTGERYEWVTPVGQLPLPALPADLLPEPSRPGTGPASRESCAAVPPGEMRDYLKDRAVRFLRAGIWDVDELAAYISAAFEFARVPGAVYGGSADDDRRLAEWAASSQIATIERWEQELVVIPKKTNDYKESVGSSHGLSIVTTTSLPAHLGGQG